MPSLHHQTCYYYNTRSSSYQLIFVSVSLVITILSTTASSSSSPSSSISSTGGSSFGYNNNDYIDDAHDTHDHTMLLDERDMSLSPKTINTKYGTLRGILIHMKTTSNGGSPQSSASSSSSPSSSPPPMMPPVEAFLGVPYASPPTKTLRFMPPVTPTYWRGVRLVNRFAPVCPQKLPDIANATDALKRMTSARLDYLHRLVPFLRNQSEDCLYLNIYAPYNPSGGGGTSSSSSSSTSSSSSQGKKRFKCFSFG